MKAKLLTSTLFALCSLFVFSSCDSEEDNATINTGPFYFEADMDGKTLILPEGKDGYASKAFVQTEATTSGCAEIQLMQLAKPNDIKKSVEVLLIEQRSSCTTDCTQTKAMLETGDYSFGRLASFSDTPMEDGVVIRYTDIYGKVWSTDFGTADQSDSNFAVTKVTANTIDNSSEFVATAEFNCTLYDETGNEIVITNGEVVSRSIVCE
ncbi:hypothetical protein [Pontibacter populi]|uniref:Lipoprotein n=1 Tax=Pontibacter populi TaxID=890055 RepID=A0ABV1RTS7_9BACT